LIRARSRAAARSEHARRAKTSNFRLASLDARRHAFAFSIDLHRPCKKTSQRVQTLLGIVTRTDVSGKIVTRNRLKLRDASAFGKIAPEAAMREKALLPPAHPITLAIFEVPENFPRHPATTRCR
jgi:hypothetical protein